MRFCPIFPRTVRRGITSGRSNHSPCKEDRIKTLLKHTFFLTVLLVLAASVAQAADITVNETTCTLAEAITSANNNADTGDCVADGISGDDTITLATDVFLSAALPQITTTITIEANGHKIDGQDNSAAGSVLHISISGVLTLNKAVITGGHAVCYCESSVIQYDSGGIYNEGQLILNSSTVSGNLGGGIYNDMGILTINNATVSENRTVVCQMQAGCEGPMQLGGGIHMSGGTVILRSSIVSGNIGRELATWEGTIIADSYNVLGHSGESNTEAFYNFTPGSNDLTATSDGIKPTALTAILSPLADNGGPTLTHALVEGSPAVDLDRKCSTGLTEDQRGEPRPLGRGCDAGSFESVYSASEPVNMTPVYMLLL